MRTGASVSPLIRIGIVLICLASWVAAAQGGGKVAKPQRLLDPRTSWSPTKIPWSNEKDLSAVARFCAERGLAIDDRGDGAMRVRLCGGAKLTDLDLGLKNSDKALRLLDEWTGCNSLFVIRPLAPQDVYWVVIFATRAQIDDWIDWCRQHKLLAPPEGGVDLAKACQGFTSIRTTYGHIATIDPLWDCKSVYATSCMAVDAYFYERSAIAPSWIREGLAAELQLMICGRVGVTSVAYALKDKPDSLGWGSIIAQLIRKRDRQIRPASELMRTGLSGLPNLSYLQMWSLCRSLRTSQPSIAGPANPFARLINATANGMASEAAVAEVYEATEPRLSTVWQQWALKQK
ncbi:MAG: hypothetical protein H0V44_00040 [Planctomycetes bacterium]|nr:hypothetical protein [Planctomycetota bacterium]